ncbi:MAG: polyprenyl synthetase family protein, partial [Candidatus Omnitrophota bacterium]|nr:polyprenyl synthetase family protein [Candidatus Omnitrophota bacterium]
FAASCQMGAMISHCQEPVQEAFREYGLNFGIAFQIVDDCLDLIGDQKHLGKAPGADFKMGELTLPLLNLVSQSKDKKKIIAQLTRQNNSKAFKDLKLRFIHSQAFTKTKEDISYYLKKAKSRLATLSDSPFKQSLSSLADFIARRIP